MSLIDEQAAFLKDIRKLLDFADEQCFLVTGGELERSPETQAIYMRNGVEKSMDSPHLRKCAMTLNVFRVSDGQHYELLQKAEDLSVLGDRWESLDPRNRWLGRQQVPLDFNRFVRDIGGWQSSSVSKLNPPDLTSTVVEAVATATNVRPGPVVLVQSSSPMPVLKPGSTDRDSVSRLQNLLVKAGANVEVDGDFGEQTKTAVMEFQKQHALMADAVVGEKTWSTLFSINAGAPEPKSQKFIGDADFEAAAKKLGIELAALKAVYKVESNGKGFSGDLPKILFEGHIFWRQLKKQGIRPEDFVKGNEDILYPVWTKAFYVGGAGENSRLARAMLIHKNAARESASWGLFQIMGFHWQMLNYASVDEFTSLMNRHERDQLDAFCRFVNVTKNGKGQSLVDLLVAKDWAGFAYSYNGSEYRKNAYDDKLRDYYRRYS